jgi:hypothetical protein
MCSGVIGTRPDTGVSNSVEGVSQRYGAPILSCMVGGNTVMFPRYSTSTTGLGLPAALNFRLVMPAPL